MNIKRGILIALALYLANFLVGIIFTILAKKYLFFFQNNPTLYWIITISITVILTCIASIWYFNKKEIKRNIKESLKLGLVFIATGFIIDLLFFIPASISHEAGLLIEHYSRPFYYINLVLVIISALFIGSRNQNQTVIKEKSSKKK